MSAGASENGALTGKRIVVTRALNQAAPLHNLIREFGAIPISYPCIAIAPPTDPQPLDTCLRQLDEFDWLLLTSSNTVDAIANRVAAGELQPDWTCINVAAVGYATRAQLRERLSIDADFTPTAYSAGQLAREIPLREISRVLLPQSNRASAETARILHERGARVTTVSAYRTVIGSGGAAAPALIARGEIDALTFVSPSAVEFFTKRCPSPVALTLPAVCLGPATSNAARANHFQQVITPPEISVFAMLRALKGYFADSGSSS